MPRYGHNYIKNLIKKRHEIYNNISDNPNLCQKIKYQFILLCILIFE